MYYDSVFTNEGQRLIVRKLSHLYVVERGLNHYAMCFMQNLSYAFQY